MTSVPLNPHPTRRAPQGPVICVVMDGIGVGNKGPGDMVAQAHTPILDELQTLPSFTTLQAHGTAVGMPSDADMGNSEVGHNVLGAGRVFDQGAKLVGAALADGRAFQTQTWIAAVAQVARSGQPLHFLGLLSDGNVHSHIDHLFLLLERAARDGVSKVRVHALLDGRDVPRRSALQYVDQLEARLSRLHAQGFDYRIASGGGRMRITMDRYEADWGMVAEGWNVHVRGRGRPFASARQAIETMYAEDDRGDQELDPFVVVADGQPVGPIHQGAAVILFNFRGDRAIEICRAFVEDEFTAFDRGPRPDVFFAGMMQYDGDLAIPPHFLVVPPRIADTMGELLSRAGCPQAAVAETQKFGHVTYFWNGNRSGAFDAALERYVEIPSERAPFQERPWMKAAEVTDAAVKMIREGQGGFIRINYANGDMVGHTGDLRATRMAVEAVDLCLQRLMAVVRTHRGVLVVTADHGNAEDMVQIDKQGQTQAKTSHTLNPVPFAVYDPRESGGGPAVRSVEGAGLANVAATCLELLGYAAPESYAPSLLSS